MRSYVLRLDGHGISREQFNELVWFCRQYPQKVKELKAIRDGVTVSGCTGMPRGNTVGDPTSLRAMRAMRLAQDVEDVEQAALEADAVLYRYVLKSVTQRVPYDRLGVPCGANQFYAARQRFFIALARRRGKIGG